ncbi:MAG TPA: hypothetical protein VHW71_12760 [Steroidobacteraceae bacterium]|jgi:hypothetical protein|nr:hypothetical protein [Steroidobacteraceae bacterium]
MKVRTAALRLVSGIGAIIGYGCLAAFLYLIGTQLYRWFRQGEWTHVGMGDGLRIGLLHCCVKDGGTGRIAGFLHWWDSPVSWLGLHKVFEVVPASLALFALSIAGNSLFIYCRDRLRVR